MLSQKSIEALKALGLNLDEIINAHSASKEVDIAIPAGKFLSDTDMETLTNNIKTDAKKSYEVAYPEIFGRKLNKEHELGLTNDETKDMAKVLKAMQDKAVKGANIEPDKKVAELQKSVETLQSMVREKEQAIAQKESALKERIEFDTYRGVIPEKANKALMPDEWVARLKKEVVFNADGHAINPATGQAYKDKLENPIPFKDYATELFTKKEGWLMQEQAAPAQPANPAKPFTHGTGSSTLGKTPVDIAQVKSQYNEATNEGRQAIRAAYFTNTINNPTS